MLAQAPPASKEQIEEYVAEVVGAQVVQNVKSEAWKERLEGAGALDAFVEEQGAGAAPHVEMLVGMLAPILSSDKNLQVCAVRELAPSLPRSAAQRLGESNSRSLRRRCGPARFY